MNDNEKHMTGEESLKIITDMITKTKLNIGQSIFHLLFWGWLILICSLAEIILANFTSFEHPYYAWLLTVPGIFVSMIYGFVRGRKQTVYTYADRLNMWTWMAFMISAILLFIFLSRQMQNVAPFILLLAGYATFLSGIIIKFKPLIYGGISFWVFALVAYLIGDLINVIPVVPMAVLTGYLLPGYFLRKEGK
ncbi:MAG: hypothetical protein V2I37_02300 [Marinilabiliaceae bacterium]|jgi:hypothetical protein|nr:hypothetical protein [Marinilabiliaceae bacterium]